MTTQLDKAAMRKAAAAKRAGAHRTANAAGALASLVAYVQAVPTVEVVSGYVPIRSELDPMPALATLHDLGYRICLPVVVAKDAPLTFRAWRPGDRLEEGAFGVSIPAAGEVMQPELLITPLLAFDDQGYRLGYGGGFYDRTLAKLRARRRTYAFGLAYDAQRVDHVPRDGFDQRLDAILTECRAY